MSTIQDKTVYEVLSEFSPTKKRWLLRSILALPVLIVALTSLVVFTSIQDDIKDYNNQINSIQETQEEIFTATVTETYKRAKLQTEYIKRDIIFELNEYYGENKEQMKKDYMSFSSDSPFYQILSNIIDNKFLDVDNDNDRIFIANRDRILVDNSSSYASNSFTDWETYISSKKYSEFLHNSVDKINIHYNSFIFWLDTNNQDNITILDDPDISADQFIHQQIVSNNLQEMRNFSVLTATYIFDHEDLFGVSDVVAGKPTNNDKLYIIQVFNIGDMIDNTRNMSKTILKYQILKERIIEDGYDTIKYKSIAFGLLVLLEIICFFGIWYLMEAYFIFHPEYDVLCKEKDE